MKPLHRALSTHFNVEALSPFGVLIRPRTTRTDLTEVPVPEARELAREHHLLVLRGFDPFPSPEELTRYAASWGEVMIWPFGAVLELVEQENAIDHVFGSNPIHFHWDGMFVERIPEFQVFQCVDAPGDGQGGRTTFCDTTRVLANASPQVRKLWEKLIVTYRIERVTHYGGAVTSPLVVPHPDRGFPTMRYLEPVPDGLEYPNPPMVEFHDVSINRAAEIEQTLRDALYDPRHHYAHAWQTGDVVVADNYTLLHGREAYASRCGRHLRRVHVLGDPPLDNPALRWNDAAANRIPLPPKGTK